MTTAKEDYEALLSDERSPYYWAVRHTMHNQLAEELVGREFPDEGHLLKAQVHATLAAAAASRLVAETLSGALSKGSALEDLFRP